MNKITGFLLSATLVTGLNSSAQDAANKATAAKQDKPAKPNVTINLDLTAIQEPLSKVYFTFYNTVSKVRFNDSADLSGAKKNVSFSAYIAEPVLGSLRVVPEKVRTTSEGRAFTRPTDILNVYLQAGKIGVTAKESLSTAAVTGSPAHIEFAALQEKSKQYDAARQAIYKRAAEARQAGNAAAFDEVRKPLDSISELINNNVYLDFIKAKGKTSPVALYALSQYAGYAIDPVKTEPVYNLLGPAVKKLPTGKSFAERIDLAKKTEIGQYAIPFTQADTAGKDVSLASFKGKYVLVDFWASWCGPCRAENPNVVKAFEKYGSKGFTVLGISLDQPGKKEAWLKAIYDDQLTWTHVSDLKYWNNEVAKLYGILAIPQNYLLDRDGKIVAKNVRGEELEKTLQNIFSGPEKTE